MLIASIAGGKELFAAIGNMVQPAIFTVINQIAAIDGADEELAYRCLFTAYHRRQVQTIDVFWSGDPGGAGNGRQQIGQTDQGITFLTNRRLLGGRTTNDVRNIRS